MVHGQPLVKVKDSWPTKAQSRIENNFFAIPFEAGAIKRSDVDNFIMVLSEPYNLSYTYQQQWPIRPLICNSNASL